MVILHKESYPETTLWAVVPKQQWEKNLKTTEAILNLVEKQVSGHSFQEGITQAEKDSLLMAQGVPQNLRDQLRQLTEAMDEARLEVRPATEEDEPMTMEELSEAENNLLHPQDNPLWDEAQ